MKVFDIYEQRNPIKDKYDGHHANIVRVDQVKAKSSSEALDKAKEMGYRWPMVDVVGYDLN